MSLTFTFSHLADTLIQSEFLEFVNSLVCHLFNVAVCPWVYLRLAKHISFVPTLLVVLRQFNATIPPTPLSIEIHYNSPTVPLIPYSPVILKG